MLTTLVLSGFDFKRKSEFDLKRFMPTLLERMDRMSMYSGLEARVAGRYRSHIVRFLQSKNDEVPFADYRLVGTWEYLTRNGTKGILRDAFDGEISKEVLWRKKNP